MANVIVASFKEEVKAVEALHKLNELESLGDITIYELVMVRKNANGDAEVLKENTSEGLGVLTGMGVGSLLGVVGGPVGVLIGLYTGTVAGALAESDNYDFADDFVSKVENKLAVGVVAIIAEIDEDNEIFVDTYLKPFGAEITRSDVDVEFDNYEDEQMEAIDKAIAEERADLKKSMGDQKKKIQSKIAELKKKRKDKMAELAAKRKAKKNVVKNK